MGRANKWADKWAKDGNNVWHEKWGEEYDGEGGCVKFTDKVEQPVTRQAACRHLQKEAQSTNSASGTACKRTVRQQSTGHA